MLPIVVCWKIYCVLRSKHRLFIHFFLIWKDLHKSLVFWVKTFQTCQQNCFLFCLRLKLLLYIFSSAKDHFCIIKLPLRLSKVLNKLINPFNLFLTTHFSSETLNWSMVLYLNGKFLLVVCIKVRWLNLIFIIGRFIWKILILSIWSDDINIWSNSYLTNVYWWWVLYYIVVCIINISRY